MQRADPQQPQRSGDEERPPSGIAQGGPHRDDSTGPGFDRPRLGAFLCACLARVEGDELIAIPLSFFLTVASLLAISLVVIPRSGFFDGLMVALFVVGTLLVLLLVRPVRVLTLWLMWMLGFVYPDRVPDKGRFTLPRG